MKNNSLSRSIFAITLTVIFLSFWQNFINNKKSDTTTITENENAVIGNKQKEQIEIENLSQQNEKSNFIIEDISVQDSLSKTSNDRVYFENEYIKGSINLKGGILDDLILLKYNESNNSEEKVRILSPLGTEKTQFVSFGWKKENDRINVPNRETKWTTNKKLLNRNETISLKYVNSSKDVFIIDISLDDQYMLKVEQRFFDYGNKNLTILPYSNIVSLLQDKNKRNVGYEGPIAFNHNKIHEPSNTDIKKKVQISYDNNHNGWIGMTGKYWARAIISNSNKSNKQLFDYVKLNGKEYIRSNILHDVVVLNPDNAFESSTVNIYLGPKDYSILKKYQNKYDIKNFSLLIDFGKLQFFTKPLSSFLTNINSVVNNYGLSIIILTLIVRLLLFPIMQSSYKSMNKIKRLNPEIEELKKINKDDQTALNASLMALYKREKINPLASILPLLLQIPVFFALYKVIFISLDLRHSTFLWWSDLSSADSIYITNLFGLLPFNGPKFIMIGVLPALMGLTTYIQQKMTLASTSTSDANQKAMKFLPLFLVFMLSGFPSGLMLYWITSNIFTICQQAFNNK